MAAGAAARKWIRWSGALRWPVWCAGDPLAYLDRFGTSGAIEQPRDAAAASDDEADESSGYVAPPYTEPPERAVPLGALLAAAGYGTEAAAQLDEAAAAETVVNIFKDSRKVTQDPPTFPAACP